MTFRWKRPLKFAAITLIGIALVVRLYAGIIPLGVKPLAWIIARVDGPTFTSPDGMRTVKVYFNDAGAAHSGNHWTWVVEDSLWKGRTVVAEGYVNALTRNGETPFELEWGPNNRVDVSFLPNR